MPEGSVRSDMEKNERTSISSQNNKDEFEGDSESPCWTYLIRVAIIYILAPVTVFTNEWIGPALSGFLDAVLATFAAPASTFLLGILLLLLLRI